MEKTKISSLSGRFVHLAALLSALLFCLILGMGASQPAWALSGSGTDIDPYLIYDADDLNTVRDDVYRTGGHYFQMANNIDLSVYDEVYDGGKGWDPIGTAANPFIGVFDGGGHTISNLFIDRPDMFYVGLFGCSEDATFVNVRLENVDIKGKSPVGALVGGAYGGSISNCNASGSVTGRGMVGGLAGRNDGGTISNSHATATVNGIGGESGTLGGLVGSNSGTVTNSHATGNVLGALFYGGGLVGANDGEISGSYATGAVVGEGSENSYELGGLVGINRNIITGSYATGDVTGTSSIGGLAGGNDGLISGSYAMGAVVGGSENSSDLGGLVGINRDTIIISYAVGAVTGTSTVGGLVGRNWGGDIENTYAAGYITGIEDVGGLTGLNSEGEITSSYYDRVTTGQSDNDGRGEPRITADMKNLDTFEGWDFNNIWAIRQNITYPYFGRQFTPPTVESAATDTAGTLITITFSKAMDDPSGKHGQFNAMIDGAARSFSAAVLRPDDATKIHLILEGTAIEHGQAVIVSYTAGMMTATDGGVLAGFTDYSVTNSVPAPPSRSGGGGGCTPALVIDKVNPPDGAVGTDYTHTFTAGGGRKPYTFAVTAGVLPEGLSLAEDGTLSGTPAVAGTCKYTVTVTDHSRRTSSHAFTQVVKDGSASGPSNPTVIILTADSLEATVNGRPYILDAAPYIEAAACRTLMPIRFVGEALGAKVDWNAETRQVTIEDAGQEIVLTIGSEEALVNGQTTAIDCAPVTMPPGRTFLPLRFVSETLGATVDYDATTGQITITR